MPNGGLVGLDHGGRTVRTPVRYEADLRDTDNAWLRLHYRANGEAVDYKVRLVTTKPGTLHENEHHLEMCAAPDGSGRLDGASVRSQLPKLHNKKSRDRRRAKWKYTDIIPQSVAQRAATRREEQTKAPPVSGAELPCWSCLALQGLPISRRTANPPPQRRAREVGCTAHRNSHRSAKRTLR